MVPTLIIKRISVKDVRMLLPNFVNANLFAIVSLSLSRSTRAECIQLKIIIIVRGLSLSLPRHLGKYQILSCFLNMNIRLVEQTEE